MESVAALRVERSKVRATLKDWFALIFGRFVAPVMVKSSEPLFRERPPVPVAVAFIPIREMPSCEVPPRRPEKSVMVVVAPRETEHLRAASRADIDLIFMQYNM